MSKLIPASLRLPEELINQYEEYSKKLNIPKTILMRDGLVDYIEKIDAYQNNSIEYAFGTIDNESIDIFQLHDAFKEMFIVFEWNDNTPGKILKMNSISKKYINDNTSTLKDFLNIDNEIYYNKILNDLRKNKYLSINRNIENNLEKENWYEFNLYIYKSKKYNLLLIKGVYLNEKINNSFIDEKLNICNIIKNNSNLLYILLDEEFRILETSDYVNIITGYEEKELFMRSFFDFTNQKKDFIINNSNIILNILSKNNKDKKINAIITKINEKNTEDKKFLIHGYDVTEKKELEFLIKKQNDEIKELINENVDQTVQTYQNIIDKIPYAIFYKDIKGHFLGCNKKFEIVFGIKNEEIIGKKFRTFFNEEIYGIIEKEEEVIYKNNKSAEFDVFLKDEFGNKKPVHFYIESWSEKSKKLGLIGVITIEEEKYVLKNILESYRKTNQYLLDNVIEYKKDNISLKEIFNSNISKYMKKNIIIESNVNLKTVNVDIIFLTILNVFFENVVDLSTKILFELKVKNNFLNINIEYKEKESDDEKLYKNFIEEIFKEKNVELIWNKNNIIIKKKLEENQLNQLKLREKIDYSNKKILLAMEDYNLNLFKILLKTNALINTCNSIDELILYVNSYDFDKIIVNDSLYNENKYIFKNIEQKTIIISERYMDTKLRYIQYPIDTYLLFKG